MSNGAEAVVAAVLIAVQFAFQTGRVSLHGSKH